MANQNLYRPFVMEFDGRFIVKPQMGPIIFDEGRMPASIGDRADAAVFELREGYLHIVNGNAPLHFGRSHIEPQGFMPMPIYWVLNRDMVKPCIYHGDEDSPTMFESEGFRIGLMLGEEHPVRAMPQPMFPGPEMRVHWQ